MGRFATSEAFPSCRFVFVVEIKKPRGGTRGEVLNLWERLHGAEYARGFT